MRVYLSSGLLGAKQLEDLVDVGFSGWELIADGAIPLDSTTLSLIQHAISSCGLELSVHAPFSDLNIASVNKPIWRETLRQIGETIAFAADYSNIFIIHPGYISPLATQCVDKAMSKNNEALLVLARSAAEYGVRVTVENMANVDGFIGRSPQDVVAMLECGVGFTFDVGHAHTTHSIDSFLEVPADHIHLHDNRGQVDEHLILGEGSIDWEKLLNTLNRYTGAYVIEARNLREGAQSFLYLKRAASVRTAERA